MTTNTYSSKSAAKLGAKRKGLDAKELSFLEDKDGRWTWETTATLEEAEEENKKPTIGTDENPKPAKGIKIEKERPEQFGITRPSEGGKCRVVWDECDIIHRQTGKPPMPKMLKEIAQSKGWNVNNAIIEMYRWRRFNGFIGRQKAQTTEDKKS